MRKQSVDTKRQGSGAGRHKAGRRGLEKRRSGRRKQILLGIATAVLVLVLAGSVGGVVLGQPQHSVKADGENYARLEKIYVEQVKALLESEGLASAGVNLTYERDRDGSRHYTLLVHHHRLEGFEEQQLEELTRQMEQRFFENEECSVSAQLVWQLEG